MYSGATNAKFFPGFMQNRKSGPKPKDSSAQGAEKTSWRRHFCLGQLVVIKVAQQKITKIYSSVGGNTAIICLFMNYDNYAYYAYYAYYA